MEAHLQMARGQDITSTLPSSRREVTSTLHANPTFSSSKHTCKILANSMKCYSIVGIHQRTSSSITSSFNNFFTTLLKSLRMACAKGVVYALRRSSSTISRRTTLAIVELHPGYDSYCMQLWSDKHT